jgi:uncharacterized protein YprB with RNaseH-like and TPR domain
MNRLLSKEHLIFKLKTIGKSLQNLNLITNPMLNQKSNINNGLTAMFGAIQYYKTYDKNIIDDIAKYNEIDCLLLQEIITLLRT